MDTPSKPDKPKRTRTSPRRGVRGAKKKVLTPGFTRGGKRHRMVHQTPFTLINRGPLTVEIKYMANSDAYAKVIVGNRWARTPIFAPEEHGQMMLYVLDLLGFETKVVEGPWDDAGDEDKEDD